MFRRDRAEISYDNLQPSEIRLIKFKPIDTSSFTIELLKFGIQDLPQYNALSYTWGGRQDDVAGSDKVSIHPNLESALTRHYEHFPSQPLWADALCINQSDITERTSQVARMTEIYRQAMLVFVWLGDEDETSGLAFDFMRECARIALFAHYRSIQDEIDLYRQDRAELQAAIDAVKGLLDRPYWSRLWIVQEVVLAREASIACGDEIIAWNDFQNSFYFLEKCGFSTLLGPGHRVWSNLNHTRAKYGKLAERTYFDLTRMLHRTREAKCTDARDKLFGLLGIANEGSDAVFQADYSKTTDEVYTHLTRQLILRDQHLDILGAVGPEQLDTGFPSWVPAWSQSLGCMSLSPRNFDGSVSYAASGVHKLDLEEVSDTRHLSVKGVFVDTIKQAIPTGVDATIAEWVDDLLETFQLPEEYSHTDQTSRAAMFRTLEADLGPSSRRTDNSHFELFFPELRAWMDANPPRGTPLPQDIEQELANFTSMVATARAVVNTQQGYIGLAPKSTKPGDIISVLFGGSLPFVLRPNSSGSYQLVGECYVHGTMDGEAVQGRREEEFVRFVLV